jgi:metal-responsive CopG/Arc/MetJ family transcriptional regulator
MRVQVSVSDEMLEKLNFYSKKMCVSRSQLMNFFCAQGLMSLDKSMSLLENMGEQVSSSLIESTLKSLTED